MKQNSDPFEHVATLPRISVTVIAARYRSLHPGLQQLWLPLGLIALTLSMNLILAAIWSVMGGIGESPRLPSRFYRSTVFGAVTLTACWFAVALLLHRITRRGEAA